MPDENKSKLDNKSEKYIFTGYDTNSKNNVKNYKNYNPHTQKITTSRDAILDEERE